MKRLILAAAAWMAVFAIPPAAAAAEGEARPPTFVLTRLVQQLPLGSVWATQMVGAFLCKIENELRANGAVTQADLNVFGPPFAQEFVAAGFGSNETSLNLFRSADAAHIDYEVGGIIKKLNVEVCEGNLISPGIGRMSVEWQVYSTATQKVVLTLATTGSFKPARGQGRDIGSMITGAFVENVRVLAASPELKSLSAQAAPSDDQTRIALKAGAARPRPIDEATGAVVLIRVGDSHGSGFLTSTEGHVLTNAHVVGDARTVKVRWSDGLETDGTVLRSHKQRDVALIKTNPRNREPLAIRQSLVSIGTTVLAIGAPLDTGLQGTVTRGVVSANRVLEGFSYVQSDVTVNPGNSGGPLVDEDGAVVAITVSGYRPEGVPAGINFFIPIKDAADFLRLDLAQQ